MFYTEILTKKDDLLFLLNSQFFGIFWLAKQDLLKVNTLSVMLVENNHKCFFCTMYILMYRIKT